MQSNPIVAANWKMHGNAQQVKHFACELTQRAESSVDVFFAPPAVYLPLAAQTRAQSVRNTDNQWYLLAQCGHHETKGAFTGAISMAMLKEIGCDAVLIGHSERRQYQGETNEECVKQVKSAIAEELTPILCIGEQDADNQAGMTERVLIAQLMPVIEALSEADLVNLVIAYEPVWAIGTGRSANANVANEIHQIIRRQIAKKHANIVDFIRLLYGGSVNADNANSLFSQKNINGALVGGASLSITTFAPLISIASETSNKFNH